MEKSLVQITNILNLSRQEFDTTEKHIYLLALMQLKTYQGFNLTFDDDKNISIEFDAALLKETNVNRVKKALDSITSRKLYIDDGKGTFGNFVPFVDGIHKSQKGAYAKIKITLNNSCKKFFLELAQGYTSTDFNAILSLKSVHTIRIYELMSMHLYLKSWTVSVEKLKGLLGLSDLKGYDNFCNFEKRVLLYSQKEIAQNCDIYFNWIISKRDKKKVTELTFNIEKYQTFENKAIDEAAGEAMNYISSLTPIEIKNNYQKLIQKYIFSQDVIDNIITNPALMREFIRVDMIIESKIEKGSPPRDRSAYMITCLKGKGLIQERKKREKKKTL